VGEKGMVSKTLKRDTVWIVQTPQVFRFAEILEAHKRAEAGRYEATDDSEILEQYGGKVAIVPGSYNNIKITTPGDMVLAQVIIKGQL
jgi:2-C-methyl-D-erythritol 4-phosphate cytidylyltransferase